MIFNTAKVMSKGQITLPVDIRRKLGLEAGDRVVIVCEGNRVILMNPALQALKEVQEKMEGVAEAAGLKSDADVVDLVMRMRRGEEI